MMTAFLRRLFWLRGRSWPLACAISLGAAIGLAGCSGCSNLPPPQQTPEEFLNQLRLLEEQARHEARPRPPATAAP